MRADPAGAAGATSAHAPETRVGDVPPVGAPETAPGDRILHEGQLAGLDPSALAEEFGTPLYVYDLDVVSRRLDSLRAVLPTGFRVVYAVKANPALAVLTHLRRAGAGADIASAGELEAVLRAGFEPASVTMTGPGKRDEELFAAVKAGIGLITVESPGELGRLEVIAARAGRRQRILLRLAVSGEGQLETTRLIGGAEGKFGMPLPDLEETARHAAASAGVELMGIHAFGASNVRDAGFLARHVSDLVETGRRVAAAAGVPLRVVDAGGGLGIPYADGERPLDLVLLGRLLSALRAGWDADPGLRRLEVILEPGRFLVGPAGAYVARVVDVKGGPDSQVAILEGGINQVLRPALVGTEHRIVALTPGRGSITGVTGGPSTPPAGMGTAASEAIASAASIDGRAFLPTLVAGPLCTGIDVLAAAAPLPPLSPRDLVAVLDVGAYGYTESMPLFLSHPWPAEVCVRSGHARLTRPGLAPRELLDRQIDPGW